MRDLNSEQLSRLDALAQQQDPVTREAFQIPDDRVKVIGWYNSGPILEVKGKVLRYLDVSGRIRALPKAGRATLTKQEGAA